MGYHVSDVIALLWILKLGLKLEKFSQNQLPESSDRQVPFLNMPFLALKGYFIPPKTSFSV